MPSFSELPRQPVRPPADVPPVVPHGTGDYSMDVASLIRPALPAMRQLLDDSRVLGEIVDEFSRTIESGAGKSQTMTSRKCVSPTDDMRAQNARLAKSGCTFSPYARSANQYTMSAKCHVMGISSDTTTVVSFESDSAYRVTVAGVTDGEKTKEVMIAKRVGDC